MLGVLLSACVVGGCDSGEVSDPEQGGPLVLGGDKSTICVQHRGGSDATYGSEVLRNESADTLSLNEVMLADAENVTVEGAWVIPIHNRLLLGAWSRWPPPSDDLSASAWSDRAPVGEATIGPGEELNLVVELHRPEPQRNSSFSHVELLYETGSTVYRRASTISLLLDETCS